MILRMPVQKALVSSRMRATYMFLDENRYASVSRHHFSTRHCQCSRLVFSVLDHLKNFTLLNFTCHFAGKFALIELDETHPDNDVSQGKIVLRNVAAEAGIERSTGIFVKPAASTLNNSLAYII